MTKILVVDHHKTKRSWLAKVFADAGFDTDQVEDAESGLKAAADPSLSAIVVTMTLPRISGSEFCQRFKDTPAGARVPVVLTSSLFRNMNLDAVAQKRWRADAYLEEPYSAEAVLGAVKGCVADYEARRAALPAAPPAPEPPAGSDNEIDPFSHLSKEDYDPIEAALAAADIASEELESEIGEWYGRESAPRARAAVPEPAPDLMIEAHGTLDDASVPEILAACFFAKVEGLLIVSDGRVAKTVYLKKGCPVHVTGEVRSETLGHLLVQEGLIDERTLYETLPAIGEGKRLGDALVERGKLSPTQLYQSLKMQAWEKMLSLFTWHRGLYRVVPRHFDAARLTTFDMWPPLLILQGVLRHYEPGDIRAIFNELKDFILRPRELPPVTYDDLRFPDEVRALYALVDGQRTVAEAVQESRLGPDKTYQVFYVLLILELFDKIDAAEVGEASVDLPEAEVSFERLVEQAIALDLTPETEASAPVASLADELEPAALRASVAAPPRPPFDEAPSDLETEIDVDMDEPEDEAAPAEPAVAAPPSPARPATDSDFDLDEDDESEPVEDIRRPVPTPDQLPWAAESAGESPDTEDVDLPDTESPDESRPAEHDDDLSSALDRALDGFLDEEPESDAEAVPPAEPTLSLAGESAFLRAGSGQGAADGTIDGDPGDAERLARMNAEDRETLEHILKTYMELEKANHYKILNIANTATDTEIRDAYTRFVKIFHPDRLQGRFTDEVIEKANAIMKRATDAYRTLYDAKRRRVYDKQLVEGGGERKERSVAMILAAENEFSMGLGAFKANNWELAKSHFQKATELFPEEGEYHACLGWSIYNLGDLPRADRTAQAKTLFEKAIKLNPRSDRAYHYMGMLLKDNDQFDKAAIMFAQAFRYNKGNVDAKNQLKALQSLRGRKSPAAKKSITARDVLQKDIKVDTIKKTILKIFW